MEILGVIQAFGPDHKNIIDIAQPSVRLKWGIFQSVSFEKAKKKVSIRGSHFSTHGGAVDLEIVVIIKEGRTGGSLARFTNLKNSFSESRK